MLAPSQQGFLFGRWSPHCCIAGTWNNAGTQYALSTNLVSEAHIQRYKCNNQKNKGHVPLLKKPRCVVPDLALTPRKTFSHLSVSISEAHGPILCLVLTHSLAQFNHPEFRLVGEASWIDVFSELSGRVQELEMCPGPAHVPTIGPAAYLG